MTNRIASEEYIQNSDSWYDQIALEAARDIEALIQRWVNPTQRKAAVQCVVIETLRRAADRIPAAIEPAQPVAKLREVLSILDEIEVGQDDRCHWSEIANAQQKIKAAYAHARRSA